ncbi:hypothetical protein NC651_018715 [Populus alba x Populus x berolinensis]|nr:hypothetical protein NC651_018715 [Populus alba x Populus x berolinensis]
METRLNSREAMAGSSLWQGVVWFFTVPFVLFHFILGKSEKYIGKKITINLLEVSESSSRLILQVVFWTKVDEAENVTLNSVPSLIIVSSGFLGAKITARPRDTTAARGS